MLLVALPGAPSSEPCANPKSKDRFFCPVLGQHGVEQHSNTME